MFVFFLRKQTTTLVFGQPFVVEDSITTDYQTILTSAAAIRNTLDRNVIWFRYMDMHMCHASNQKKLRFDACEAAIERLMFRVRG